MAHLFNHLVGSIEQAKWYGETKRPGGLQVDDEIEFSWLQNWKIGRLFTFEDSSGVDACLPIRIGDAGGVADQAACKGILSKVIHGGQTILCRERNDPIASGIEVCIGGDEQRADPLLEKKRESGLPQTVMSALPLKTDMCGARAHVCFGPKADTAHADIGPPIW